MNKDDMNNKNNIQAEMRLSTSRCLFLLCFLVYCTSYIARGSFSFVRSTMQESGAIDVKAAAAISAAYFIFYAIGQLVNGFLGDRISPFWMVTVGLCIVIISNAMMSLSHQSWVYVILWGINGYGHSMLWSPVFFILSNIVNSKMRVFALTAISVCAPLGKIASALVSSVALKGGVWQNVFFTVTVILATVMLLWVVGYITLKKSIVTLKVENNTSQNEHIVKEKNKGFFKLLFVSGVAIMLPAMLVHGLFYNGVVELIPTILYEEYSMSASMAAILEIIIPILSIVGVFFANFVYFKIFKQNDMRSAAFLMAITLVPIIIMFLLAIFRREGYMIGQYPDAIIFVTTYALVYLFQFAFNHVAIVLMPAKFARFSCSSTISGVANAINYGGSAISTYGMTYALLRLPLWQTVLVWGAALMIAIVLVTAAQGRWGRFAKDMYLNSSNNT
ncbi:MAG: MFS transporter [Ruminococcaceae bacterium]|nr:MFS transporter [Oscillospiraceae bacterium]